MSEVSENPQKPTELIITALSRIERILLRSLKDLPSTSTGKSKCVKNSELKTEFRESETEDTQGGKAEG